MVQMVSTVLLVGVLLLLGIKEACRALGIQEPTQHELTDDDHLREDCDEP